MVTKYNNKNENKRDNIHEWYDKNEWLGIIATWNIEHYKNKR
jgi:hypothetical protein